MSRARKDEITLQLSGKVEFPEDFRYVKSNNEVYRVRTLFRFRSNPVSDEILAIRGVKKTFINDVRILFARLLSKKLKNVTKLEFKHTIIKIKEKEWRSSKSYRNPDTETPLRTAAKFLIAMELKEESFAAFVNNDEIYRKGRYPILNDEDEDFGGETIILDDSSEEEENSADSAKTCVNYPQKKGQDLKREHSRSSFASPPKRLVLAPAHSRTFIARPKPSDPTPFPREEKQRPCKKQPTAKVENSKKKRKKEKKDKPCLFM